MRLTHFFMELHFSEPIEDEFDPSEVENAPAITCCGQNGERLGTSRILAVTHPLPHVARMEFSLDDLAFPGLPEAGDGLSELLGDG